jgi:16S rRNA processing protein RimM
VISLAAVWGVGVFVEMGEIVGATGLRGELRVLPRGSFDEEILRSRYLRLRRPSGGTERVRCGGSRWKGSVVIVRLEDVGDRGAAQDLVGSDLGFVSEDYERPDFPRGDEPAPFVFLGLRVETVDGLLIGTVDDVLVLPANRVLRVVRDPDDREGSREVLIPVIDDVVREVDRVGGRVLIEPLPGLLDDDEPPVGH